MTFKEFEAIIKAIFPEVSEEQIEKFRALEALYKDWNSKINVVSRKDIDQIYRHHVLHSLGIAGYLKFQKPEEYQRWRDSGTEGNETVYVMDLGTGGGFPGVPLAIMFPGVKFTLCDSIGKKIIVATEVSKGAGLENVTTVNARAESLEQNFDFIVSRAVTALENFLPWVAGKYSKSILYLKGGDLNEEICTAMRKFKLPKGSVKTWTISSLLADPFFEEKMVIEIDK